MTSLVNSIDETINFNKDTIRIVGTFENPLFVAKDICKILELSNVTETLRSLPEKWKQICDLSISEVTYSDESRARKTQKMNCITEGGLYKLIMRSNKPIAQRFQEVVCDDILPTLRKKGEYKIQSIIDKNKELEEEKLRLENEKIKIEEDKKQIEQEKISLEEDKKQLEEDHKKYEPRVITEEKFVVYLLVAHINGRTIYIIGKTADINKRYRSYRLKGILIHEEDIKLQYYKSCRSSTILNQVESCVILNMSKHIVEGTREVFETSELNETEMIDKFKEVIDFYVESFKHVLPHIKIGSKELKEEIRLRTELYVEENRDKINEKVRQDRIENPEKFKEREKKRDPEKKKAKNKRYNEKHKEKIAEYHAEYRSKPENKQKINERRKRNQAKLTPEQIEEKSRKAKEYREHNKTKRKEKSSQKIKCLVCKSILSRQCWKRHTTSSFHTEAYKLNPNLDEDFEIVDNIIIG